MSNLRAAPRRVVLPLPAHGFETTEASVPWKVLTDAGCTVTIATPDGAVAQPDETTLTGKGLGMLGYIFRAQKPARAAYAAMSQSASFQAPVTWSDINADDFDAIVIPGGHHQDMRPFLESVVLQAAIGEFFAQDKLVAAICHGVLLAARSTGTDGNSVLYGRRATTVPAATENMVWKMCHKKVGHERFGKPYDLTAEEEVRELLASPDDLLIAKPGLRKDAPGKEARGVCIVDGNFLSSRLPHDAWCFAKTVAETLLARAHHAPAASRASEATAY